MKVIAPRLRTFCTQPASVTVSFTFAARNWPQVWVLYMVVSVFFVIVVLRFTKVVKTGWNPTIPPGGFHRVSSTVCKGRKMSAEWNKLVRFFIRASSLL
nr:levan sucrase [bacterium]